MNVEELLWFHHWLIFQLGRIAWIICRHIFNIPITAHGWRCSTWGQISSFVLYLWLNIWTLQDHCLNISSKQSYPRYSSHCSWSKTQRPNHHLHFSTSGQISSLFLSISDENSELGRIAWILNSPSPSSSHAHSPCALHHGLVLVLLVSRPLIMVAASWGKLTSISWIPQQVARASAQACRQGCCQAAVNKLEAASALVWFGSMHGPVPDRWKANQLGRAGAQ